MSKVLRATCADGKVTALGTEVPAARILSEGIAASEGVLVLDEERADYIAKTSVDLKVTLEKIVDALSQISAALNTLNGAGFLIGASSAVPWSGSVATQITAIGTAKSALETLKDNLR
jgi:hypothetical protein